MDVQKLKRWLKRRIAHSFKLYDSRDMLYENINLDLTRSQKRILVCYLDFQQMAVILKAGVHHTNYLEFVQILKALIELDFVIDVSYYDSLDLSLKTKEKCYDYILGMGNAFREGCLNSITKRKILYITENPYEVSYRKEQERLDYFYQRTHIKKKLERTGVYYKSEDLKIADTIICVGDKKFFDFRTKDVYRVTPSGLRNYNYKNTFYTRDTKSFLLFSSSEFIHKGIDITIEIFNRHSDWKLYICGGSKWEHQLNSYGYKLNPNITLCGLIDVNSNRFIELAKKCTFTILLSCSEASPTGVLTCMRHGLIPIVQKDLGMELYDKYCFILNDYHIEYCEKEILRFTGMDRGKLEEMSDEIYEYANKEFSLSAYTDRFRNTIKAIMEKNGEI